MLRSEEPDLIIAAQKGDIKAFEELAKRYQQMIFTLAMRIMKHREEAKDLSQEVLMKIYKNINQFRAESNFGAWIYRITYNTAINKIRKLSNQKLESSIEDVKYENWEEINNVLDEIEKKEKRKTILEALSQLNELDNYLIHAFYFDEISIRELSEISGLSESNIKVKLYRIRKTLYKILSKPALKSKLL